MFSGRTCCRGGSRYRRRSRSLRPIEWPCVFKLRGQYNQNGVSQEVTGDALPFL